MARAYLVARVILEPMAHIPGKHAIQVAGAGSNRLTNKTEDGKEYNNLEGDNAELRNLG